KRRIVVGNIRQETVSRGIFCIDCRVVFGNAIRRWQSRLCGSSSSIRGGTEKPTGDATWDRKDPTHLSCGKSSVGFFLASLFHYSLCEKGWDPSSHRLLFTYHRKLYCT